MHFAVYNLALFWCFAVRWIDLWILLVWGCRLIIFVHIYCVYFECVTGYEQVCAHITILHFRICFHVCPADVLCWFVLKHHTIWPITFTIVVNLVVYDYYSSVRGIWIVGFDGEFTGNWSQITFTVWIQMASFVRFSSIIILIHRLSSLLYNSKTMHTNRKLERQFNFWKVYIYYSTLLLDYTGKFIMVYGSNSFAFAVHWLCENGEG